MNSTKCLESCIEETRQTFEKSNGNGTFNYANKKRTTYSCASWCYEKFGVDFFKINFQWGYYEFFDIADFLCAFFSFLSLLSCITFFILFLEKKLLRNNSIVTLCFLEAILYTVFFTAYAKFTKGIGELLNNSSISIILSLYTLVSLSNTLSMLFYKVNVTKRPDYYSNFNYRKILVTITLGAIFLFPLIYYILQYKFNEMFIIYFTCFKFSLELSLFYYSKDKKDIFYCFSYFLLTISSILILIYDFPPQNSLFSSNAFFSFHHVVIPFFYYETRKILLKNRLK